MPTTSLDTALRGVLSLTLLVWIVVACAAAFITFIGLVLTVALIAGPERAERARQILTELLSFVTGLVAILRLAPRQAPHARSTHEAPE